MMGALQKSAAENLRGAKARIENPKDWTQGHMFGPAGSACARGAIIQEAPSNWGLADMYLGRAARELFGDDPKGPYAPVVVNDEFGHPYVMAMYDRAIELAEEEA